LEEYFKISFPERRENKLPKTFFVAAYRNMAEWLRKKATLNPSHMRTTFDPNDHNYAGPSQDKSSTAMEEDGDGIGPPAGEYTYGIFDLTDCTIDLTSNSIGVFSADDKGGDASPQ
jgi:hypothetical protein